MANVTLVRGATNFATSASTTLTFYNTQRESPRQSANLIPIPIPGSGSTSLIAFDLLGTTFDGKIRGIFVETTAPLTVKNFTSDLMSLNSGAQGNTGAAQVGYLLTLQSVNGDISNQFRVYINDVSWDYVAGEPMTIEYEVSFLRVDSSSG